MPNINIAIRNKYAIAAENTPNIVCDNKDYTITFDFDSEWDSHDVKTVRFEVGKDCYDVVISGNVVEVPVVSNVRYIKVGVYAGDLHTTAPVVLSCEESILGGEGVPVDPPESVYAQIAEMLNDTFANVEQTEDGAVINIKDQHGETVVVIKNGRDGKDGVDGVDGEDGKDGVDGKDGADGNGVFYVDANFEEIGHADRLVQDGVYRVTEPTIESGYPFDEDSCIVIVQNNGTMQIMFSKVENLGEQPHIFSRAKLDGSWQMWVSGVQIPEGSIGGYHLADGEVTQEKLAKGILVSVFENDKGYLTEVPQELPDGYRRLSYLESSGTQYIDTGITPAQTSGVHLWFAGKTGSSTNDFVFGASDDTAIASDSTQNSFKIWRHKSGNGVRCAIGSGVYAFRSEGADIGGKYSLVYSDQKKGTDLYFNDTYLRSAYPTISQIATMLLFGIGRPNESPFLSSCKIFACQILDGDEVVRDFVPALDKYGVACMFDKVSQTPFYNAGSGVFTFA